MDIEIDLKKAYDKMLVGASEIAGLICAAALRGRAKRETVTQTKATPAKERKPSNCITGTADLAELANLPRAPVANCRDGSTCLAGNLFIYKESGRLRLRFKPIMDSDGRYSVIWETSFDGKHRIIGDVSKEG